jgi:hypothetical protein
MNWNFISRASLLMGPVGLLDFTFAYVFAISSLGLSLFFFGLVIVCGLAVVRSYALEQPSLKSWNGFAYFFIHIYTVFILVLALGVFVRYMVYNQIDPDYKFERAERSYQTVYEHRLKKDLPLPDKPDRGTIIEQHSLTGLLTARKTEMVVNFIFSLLAYLPALFFHHLHYALKPKRDGAGI